MEHDENNSINIGSDGSLGSVPVEDGDALEDNTENVNDEASEVDVEGNEVIGGVAQPHGDLSKGSLGNDTGGSVEDVPITAEDGAYNDDKSRDALAELTGNMADERIQKSKKPLLIAAAVILAVVTAIAIFLAQSPASALAKARKATSADYMQFVENPLFSAERKYAELTPRTEGEFSLTIHNITSATGLPLSFLNGGEILGSLNVDEDEKRLDMSLEARLQQESVVNLNLNMDGELLSVNIPELMGDKYLSADFGTLNNDIENNPLAGYLGVPYYDYATVAENLFAFSGKVNELNSLYGTGGGEELDELIPVLDPDSTELDTRYEIIEGKGETNGIQCKTYELNLPAEFAQGKYNEFVEACISAYESEIERSAKALEGIVPGYTAAYFSTGQMREVFDRIVFDQPVNAVFYVDNKHKIRRSVYNAVVSIDGELNDLTLDVMKNGDRNVYDALEIAFSAATQSNEFNLKVTSEGNHSDKNLFTDNSTINVSYNDNNTAESSDLTINSAVSYEAETGDIELAMEITDAYMPGVIAFGFGGRTEVDGSAKTYNATFDEIYLDFPGLSLSFGLSYGYGPASGSPGAAEVLNGQELFKMGEVELTALYSEMYNNYQTLMQKIVGLFGL